MPNSNAGQETPLIVSGSGSAGAPAAGVVSVQGVASGIAMAVSGTVAVTQSTSPWVVNLTQMNNVALGSPVAFGTAPGTPASFSANVSLFKGTAAISATNLLFTNISDGTTAMGTMALYGTTPGAVTSLNANAFITNAVSITNSIITFIGTANNTTGSSVTTLSVTYTPTANNFVVLGISTNGAVSAVTCVDNNSNALAAGPTSGSNVFLFSGFAKAGATSYTFTWTSATTATIAVVEYNNVSGIGATSTATGSSTTPGITLSTTKQGSFLVAVLGEGTSAVTWTANSGSLRVGTNRIGIVDKQTANPFLPGSLTCSATISPTEAWVALAIELVAANTVAPSVSYQSTIPALATGQTIAVQGDTTGGTYVNTEGRKKTYSTYQTFTAAAGVIAVLPGNATTTVRVLRVEVSISTSGTAAIETVSLIKTSAASTSGTSAAMTVVPHDTGFAAASSAPLNYTVAPTPGTPVGTIRGVQFADSSSAALPGANTWLWDWGMRPGTAIVLRGTAQTLEINLGAVVTTQTATVSFEWTEE